MNDPNKDVIDIPLPIELRIGTKTVTGYLTGCKLEKVPNAEMTTLVIKFPSFELRSIDLWRGGTVGYTIPDITELVIAFDGDDVYKEFMVSYRQATS